MAPSLYASDMQMPSISLGTFKIRGYDTVYRTLDAALKSGYRSIDTASVYRNEEDIGKAMKDLLQKHELKRKDIFITSKLGPKDHGGGRCFEAVMKCTERLGIDYLDLCLIHWPGTQGMKPDDPKHPILRKQSWFDLEKLTQLEKVRYIGISNYTIHHMEDLLQYCTIKPAVLQIEHHPYLIQTQLLKFCREHGIFFQAYSSLGTSAENNTLLNDPVICSLAEKYKKVPAQILLKWSYQQNIGVIPKSTNPEHIKQNIELDSFCLSEEDLGTINALNKDEHFCWNPESVT